MTAQKVFEYHGKELFPQPNADGTISSNFMKVSGLHHFGLQMFSDNET